MNSDETVLAIERLTVDLPPWADRPHAVEDVNLDLKHDQILCVVGESGSGKSVTALSILRLATDAHVSGSVVFNGEDLLAKSSRAMRGIRGNEIAMIFQEPMTALNPLYSVGNQIAEVIELHEGLSKSQANAKAIELLARTGIPDPARRVEAFPHQLSGGQRQRAMIAMALACNPKLLIADEPTTALDVTIQAQIIALLDDLQREFRMAILFITHDLNLVRRFCHRVGVMERGHLVEQGAAVDVFVHPKHPYTVKLINSRPQRAVEPVAADAPVVVSAQDVEVDFATPRGWFRKDIFRAVQNATLELRRGETLGIVGESGSGKTTLGMALLALQPIAQGAVTLTETNGSRVRLDDADRPTLRAMRRRMQVVFQDPFGSLSPRMTVGEIVGEGVALHMPQLSEDGRRARILAMLSEVGLDEAHGMSHVLTRYPHEFSGGQRQRIAIARAVILQPEILVLDEPTSALDVSVQQQVLRLLGELQRKYAMSYVFISHDLAVIRAMCHRVLVMKDGAIVEEGEAESVFTSPRQPYTRALVAAAHLAA